MLKKLYACIYCLHNNLSVRDSSSFIAFLQVIIPLSTLDTLGTTMAYFVQVLDVGATLV